jgi:hypothetical protein
VKLHLEGHHKVELDTVSITLRSPTNSHSMALFRNGFPNGNRFGHPGDKLRTYIKSLTLEDIEIRKRLFWSCYTYDKVISLFLGRMPAFTPPLEGNFPRFCKF